MASWNSTQNYELNSSTPWNFDNAVLPADTPIWILAEQDTCDPTMRPSIFRAIYNPQGEFGQKTKLLDFDPEKEDEVLNPNYWHIVAWRPMTDHGGTWDKHYAQDGITERSNWKLAPNKAEGEHIWGTFFEYRLKLSSEDELLIAKELYRRFCQATKEGVHPCNFHIGQDTDDPLCLLIYNEEGDTNLHFLASYLLELGILLNLTGKIMLSYAKLVKLEECKDSDGGGCVLIDFDKQVARLTSTARIAHLFEKERMFWWRRVFDTVKRIPSS